MTDWSGVRERVQALAEAPGAARVFGAAGHGFALEAPLTAAEVAEAEEWFGVELPEEYRSFLTRVGAGGAGPAYGVLPLRRDGSGGWLLAGDHPEEFAPQLLTEPFPGGTDPAAVAAILAERPDWEEYEDPADLDVALDLWEGRLAEAEYDPRRTPGALRVCDEGCGLALWLVVTGPERGRIWKDQRCDEMDLNPLRTPDGAAVRFADWYLGWLADAEARR